MKLLLLNTFALPELTAIFTILKGYWNNLLVHHAENDAIK